MLELARVCTHLPFGLPRWLLIDLAAIVRFAHDTGLQDEVWLGDLAEALRRTARHCVLWVGTLAVASDVADDEDVREAGQKLSLLAGFSYPSSPVRHVIQAGEPLAAAIVGAGVAVRHDLAVLTAGVGLGGHYYELWPLADGVRAILDVGSGQLWTKEVLDARVRNPEFLPELAAITGHETGRPPLGGGYAARRDDVIAEWLRAGRPPDSPLLSPPTLREVLADIGPRLEAEAARVRGQGRSDATAREELDATFDYGPDVPGQQGDPTVYVSATVRLDGGEYYIDAVSVQIDGEIVVAADAERAKRLLADTVRSHPGRWFAPRGLDMLAAMIDQQIPTPRAVVDPGLCAFVMDPDRPAALHDLSAVAFTLSPREAGWMSDIERISAPPPNPARCLAFLPMLDRDIGTELLKVGLRDLIESDIAPTLPALARLERQGLQVRVPGKFNDWEQVLAQVRKGAELLRETYEPRLGPVDLAKPDWNPIVAILYNLRPCVPDEYSDERLGATDLFERLVHFKCPEAVALRGARARFNALDYWLDLLSHSSGRMRGVQKPATTGRWVFARPALQALPKRGSVGKLVRGALGPPEGYELISVDYNAFEVRLLAALSKDPRLIEACQYDDAHTGVASVLSRALNAEIDREVAKPAMLAVSYGVSELRFMRQQAKLPCAFAQRLYHVVGAAFPRVDALKRAVAEQWQIGGSVRVHGGWRRSPVPESRAPADVAKAKRQVFSTYVQGAGACILRRVLRRLDDELPSVGGTVVHQAHDEVFAIARRACVREVVNCMEEVMQSETAGIDGLKLVTTKKTGPTWAGMKPWP